MKKGIRMKRKENEKDEIGYQKRKEKRNEIWRVSSSVYPKEEINVKISNAHRKKAKVLFDILELLPYTLVPRVYTLLSKCQSKAEWSKKNNSEDPIKFQKGIENP